MRTFTLSLRIAAAILSWHALSNHVLAQNLQWQNANGTMTAHITSIAVSPDSAVFATDDSAYVFRIEPNGTFWSRSSIGPTVSSSPATTIGLHPSGRLFAVSGGKAFASDDHGKHWDQVLSWTRIGKELGFTLHGTVLVGSTGATVARSTNQGSTWATSTLPSNASDPTFCVYDSNTMLAATTKGVYRSDNEGDGWSLTENSPTPVTARAIARNSQMLLFAAGDSGVYVSADTGKHWAKGAGAVDAAAVGEYGGTAVCGGGTGDIVYRTTDGGTSWQPTGAVLDVQPRCLIGNPSWHFVAGTSTGLLRSSDAGTTWTRMGGGLEGERLGVIRSLGTRVVVARRDSGIFSTFGHATWTESTLPPEGVQVQCIMIASPLRFLAGTSTKGIYRTTDGGTTWAPASTGLTTLDVRALLARSSAILYAGTTTGVFYSADSGATWISKSSGLPATVVRALSLISESKLLAATGGAGMYRSSNNGATWVAANSGLTDPDVASIAVSPLDGWVFAGTSNSGVFVSSNSGNNWVPANSGLSDPHVHSLAFNSSGHLFAGTPTAIFRSTDNGASWSNETVGLPSTPVTGLAMTADDDLFVSTDGSGVYRAATLAPREPPAPVFRWMSVGALHNFFSSYGCEPEASRVWSTQDGWRWPAQYPRQDMQVAKGLWIATTQFTDHSGQLHPHKVLHLGPRSDGSRDFTPLSITTYGRARKATVQVNGVESYPPIPDEVDRVLSGLQADRFIINTVNSSLGITMSRHIFQLSHHLHDNYIIQEYTFTNTGNTDADPVLERPGVTLDSVYFYFIYRLAICADTRYVIGNSTGWGYNTMLDTRGDGVVADPPGEQFRAQFAWHGRFPSFASYDNIGGPIWDPYYDPTDTTGRLGAAQFSGVITIHAATSATDTTDDPTQPSTTSWEGSDEPAFNPSTGVDAESMARDFGLITRGHRNPRHAWQVEPSGAFSSPTGNPALGTPGGFSVTNGYGPYRLSPGESVRIVMAEASAGLSREKCVSIGQQYRQGLISATAKNDSVLTGRDSLFQTFRRAIATYESVFAIPHPPLPPKTLSVTSGADAISLAWTVGTDLGPNVTGYKIYRAAERSDGEFTLLSHLPPDADAYGDSSAVPGVAYYYAVTTVGDSLESSRLYAQSYDPAFVTTTGVEASEDGIPRTFLLFQNHPNPFNPATVIRYGLPVRSRVTLEVFNMLGQRVSVLQEGEQDAGYHEIMFDGRGLASGVYICRFEAGGFVASKKLLLIR